MSQSESDEVHTDIGPTTVDLQLTPWMKSRTAIIGIALAVVAIGGAFTGVLTQESTPQFASARSLALAYIQNFSHRNFRAVVSEVDPRERERLQRYLFPVLRTSKIRIDFTGKTGNVKVYPDGLAVSLIGTICTSQTVQGPKRCDFNQNQDTKKQVWTVNERQLRGRLFVWIGLLPSELKALRARSGG